MKWLRRLFGGKTDEESRSRQQLGASIAQAASSLGDATLTVLTRMEEMIEKPLSPQEQQSVEQSLTDLESTLSTGVVPATQAKDARERIRALREKLSEMKEGATAGKDQGDALLEKCGGCGSSEVPSLELVRDKNNNRGYLCSSCKNEYARLLQPDSIRRFWMCGACGFRILAGTRIDAEVDPEGKCPNCSADVNASLVNLSDDRPVKSGIIGEPLD